MTDEKKPAGVSEIPVEDFGIGVVKLVSDGLSGVLGAGRGDAAGMVKSLRAKAGEILKKFESGSVFGNEKKID